LHVVDIHLVGGVETCATADIEQGVYQLYATNVQHIHLIVFVFLTTV